MSNGKETIDIEAFNNKKCFEKHNKNVLYNIFPK